MTSRNYVYLSLWAYVAAMMAIMFFKFGDLTAAGSDMTAAGSDPPFCCYGRPDGGRHPDLEGATGWVSLECMTGVEKHLTPPDGGTEHELDLAFRSFRRIRVIDQEIYHQGLGDFSPSLLTAVADHGQFPDTIQIYFDCFEPDFSLGAWLEY